MQTFEVWRARVAGSTQGMTDGQIDAVAKACHEKTQAGIQTCVWHEASVLLGQLDRCQCGPCCKARGEGGRYR